MKTTPQVLYYHIRESVPQLVYHAEKGHIDGAIVTPHGVVRFLIQGNCVTKHLTRFDFVTDGFHYMVSFPRRYSTQFAITLANRLTEFGPDLL